MLSMRMSLKKQQQVGYKKGGIEHYIGVYMYRLQTTKAWFTRILAGTIERIRIQEGGQVQKVL